MSRVNEMREKCTIMLKHSVEHLRKLHLACKGVQEERERERERERGKARQNQDDSC